jgi:hypothetical protein
MPLSLSFSFSPAPYLSPLTRHIVFWGRSLCIAGDHYCCRLCNRRWQTNRCGPGDDQCLLGMLLAFEQDFALSRSAGGFRAVAPLEALPYV